MAFENGSSRSPQGAEGHQSRRADAKVLVPLLSRDLLTATAVVFGITAKGCHRPGGLTGWQDMSTKGSLRSHNGTDCSDGTGLPWP